jgi:hypothetical protein
MKTVASLDKRIAFALYYTAASIRQSRIIAPNRQYMKQGDLVKYASIPAQDFVFTAGTYLT